MSPTEFDCIKRTVSWLDAVEARLREIRRYLSKREFERAQAHSVNLADEAGMVQVALRELVDGMSDRIICPECGVEEGEGNCAHCDHMRKDNAKEIMFSGQCNHGAPIGQPCAQCGRMCEDDNTT